MLSNKKNNEIKKICENFEKNIINFQFDVQYNEIFEEILDNNDDVNYFKIYGETNDTMLHIICRKGYINLLNKILNKPHNDGHSYFIDLDIKNLLGESLIDVLPITKDGMEMLQIILRYEKSK